MAAFVRIDMFPATVTVNGTESFAPARTYVTDDSVLVYMDASNGPELVYSDRLADFEGRRTIGYTATTDSGDVVSINRASGCGCGSRLRGYDAFAGIPRVANP